MGVNSQGPLLSPKQLDEIRTTLLAYTAAYLPNDLVRKINVNGPLGKDEDGKILLMELTSEQKLHSAPRCEYLKHNMYIVFQEYGMEIGLKS